MSYWARYKDEWDTAAESTVSSCRKRYVSTYLKYSHVLNPGSTHTGFESPKQNALYENSKESIRVVPNSVLACLFLQVTALTTKLSLYCLINLSLLSLPLQPAAPHPSAPSTSPWENHKYLKTSPSSNPTAMLTHQPEWSFKNTNLILMPHENILIEAFSQS